MTAVEIDPVLAHRLAGRLPSVEVVPADVAELPTLLALRGLGAADVVVSGLGRAATRPGRADPLLPVIAGALTDDGVFVQLASTATSWAAPARVLREELDACFAEVTRSPVVWRNLPPRGGPPCRGTPALTASHRPPLAGTGGGARG